MGGCRPIGIEEVLSNLISFHSSIHPSSSPPQTPQEEEEEEEEEAKAKEGIIVMASTTPAILLRTPTFSTQRSSFNGTSLPTPVKSFVSVKNSVICRAQKQGDPELIAPVTRRLALSLLLGAAAVTSKVSPADAAYGEAANIFGAEKKNTDFKPYNGNGFNVLIPSKWNPSKEVEYPGQVLRYEDNFDPNTNVSVMVIPTDKKSIKDYGPPEQFLNQVDFLLGKQAYSGKTQSEGGFDPDAVATASLLESAAPVINGKQYYTLNVLTRTADGDEGGKHQLITATISDGKLYICKAQAGDKRWFKGVKRFVENTANSFNVA